MFSVGEIVIDNKTGGMGLVTDRHSDSSVDLFLTLLNGKMRTVTRDTADLEKTGRTIRSRFR